MKKTICFALALIMMLAMVPLTASAYEIDEQGVYYELNEDGTEYYVCNLSKTAENVTIPANFNNLPVTTIDYYAFSDSPNLKSVTVGSNVTFIDSYAFQNCTGLETITIPSWVSKVGIYVFKGCTNLQTINCRRVNRTSGWDKYWNVVVMPR